MAKRSTKKDETRSPSHSTEVGRLNRVKGQIEGAIRMVEAKKYCPDIITQLRAARQALASIEASVLKTHLTHCVRETFQADNKRDIEVKVTEIIDMFYKTTKKL